MRRFAPIFPLLAALFLIGGGSTILLRPEAPLPGSPPSPSISHLPSSQPPASGSPSLISDLPSPKSQAQEQASPLHITTPPPKPIPTGTSISLPLAATGGTKPYTWSATGGTLPRGLTFDPITATISGTPTTPETKKIRIRATGQKGKSDTIELPLQTLGETIITSQKALEATNFTLQYSHFTLQADIEDGTQATEYKDALEATNGTPPYHYSATGLPQGILLDPTTGILTGTPIQGGLYQIQTIATDASGETATTAAELFIQALPLQILTPPEIAKATPGKKISEPLIATGGYPPYTWAAAPTRDIPIPIAATASILTGTAPEEPGIYPITLAVSDQSGTAIAGATTISVQLGKLEILTPEKLPHTRTGKPLDLALEATGSIPPLTWSSTFPFPQDLTLTPRGNLTGTPEEPLDFSFEATVTSASGETATTTFTLQAAPAVAPARDLQAFPSDRKAAFTWTLPDDLALDSIALVANSNNPPQSPEDGQLLFKGRAESALITDLPENAQLHIAVFSLTAEGESGNTPDDAHTTLTLLPFYQGKADPHADAVADYSPLSPGAFGSNDLSRVLGPPAIGNPFDTVSLGASTTGGGSITVTFEDNIITNGPGADFTVFENPFGDYDNNNSVFIEPAIVSVSQDGITFRTFPFDYVPHFKSDGITPNAENPFSYATGFAGVTPSISGGDQFDLSSIGLEWIRYVRITSTGDNSLTDINGDSVRHTSRTKALSGEGKSGFDLDAVSAIHF